MIGPIAHVQRSLAIERRTLHVVELIDRRAVGSCTAHEALAHTITDQPAMDAIVELITDVHVLIRVDKHRHGIVELTIGGADSACASHRHTRTGAIGPLLNTMVVGVSDENGFRVIDKDPIRAIELRRSSSSKASSSHNGATV